MIAAKTKPAWISALVRFGLCWAIGLLVGVHAETVGGERIIRADQARSGSPGEPLYDSAEQLPHVRAARLALADAAPPPDTPKHETLRVMTYNIHHGEGVDGELDLKRIAALIRRERADIVALQEVDRRVARTNRRDFPAELAELTGMTSVFSNNLRYQGGEYGNAVLTRFHIVEHKNRHYRMVRSHEQRGLLQVVLHVRGHTILVMNTHLDFRPDDTERLSNVDEIFETADPYDGVPTIICGDFNDTPGSATHRKIKERFLDVWEECGNGNGFTFSSTQPRKRIDFIFLSKNGPLKPIKAWVPDSLASDHLPVVVELRDW